MKKSGLFSIILLGTFFLINAQVLTVTNPNSSSIWTKGNTYTINWTKSGRMDAYVKLMIHTPDGTTMIKIITTKTLNDGDYSWTVPDDITPGSYVLKVKTVDDTISDNSEVFNIKDRERELPDLMLKNVTCAKLFKCSDPAIQAEFDVWNIGNADLPSDKYYRVSINICKDKEKCGFFIYQKSVPYGLKKNSFIRESISLDYSIIPESIRSQLKYIGWTRILLEVDCDDYVDEVNENNNRYWCGKVVVECRPKIDLTVSNCRFEKNNHFKSGDWAPIILEIKNNGPDPAQGFRITSQSILGKHARIDFTRKTHFLLGKSKHDSTVTDTLFPGKMRREKIKVKIMDKRLGFYTMIVKVMPWFRSSPNHEINKSDNSCAIVFSIPLHLKTPVLKKVD